MEPSETPINYYICKSIHERTADAAGFAPLYEERFTLIQATSRAEADKKAKLLVGDAAHSYKNADGNTLTWTCKRIVEVVDTVDTALNDGSELYGRFFNDLDAYVRASSHSPQADAAAIALIDLRSER